MSAEQGTRHAAGSIVTNSTYGFVVSAYQLWAGDTGAWHSKTALDIHNACPVYLYD